MVDSLRMLYAMPRRLGTHRSAWISQQPRQSAEFAPLQGVVRHWLSQGVGGVSGLLTASKFLRDSLHMLCVMSRRWSNQPPELLDRAGTTSQLRMCNSAKLWGPACVRGLEAAASLVRRAKVWVTPPTCASRCGHVAGTIIYLQGSMGGTMSQRREGSTLWCWMRFLDSVAGGCG